MKAVRALSPFQMRNILYATDFSSAANSAIPYAREIARRCGANLVALHVRKPVLRAMAAPEERDLLELSARTEEEKQRDILAAAFPGIHPAVIIQEGDIRASVAEAVAKHRIDLIVMGTSGRTGVRKLVLGSTAEEILRQAFCPVLTVGPYGSTASFKGEISEILFATNFDTDATAAACYAASLAQEFKAKLTLVHVVSRESVARQFSPQVVIQERLQKLMPSDIVARCQPAFVVEEGDPAEEILNLANKKSMDLIILGAHPMDGIPGAGTHLPIATVHKVVSGAACPVLTVRSRSID